MCTVDLLKNANHVKALALAGAFLYADCYPNHVNTTEKEEKTCFASLLAQSLSPSNRQGRAIDNRGGIILNLSISKKLQANPRLWYAMSIAASWAGAGSLMNSTALAKNIGIVPALIWCVCNTLACIVFGLLIWKLPTIRRIMRMKVCRMILALFSIFQIWLAMTAINDAWSSIIGKTNAMLLTFGFTMAFIIALYRHGIIANILTDNGGMYIIYALVAALAIVSLIVARGNFVSLSFGLEKDCLVEGAYKGLLLLPGPFTYPYFFRLVDYNEQNEDGVSQCDIVHAFISGGIGFGVYMAFAFSLVFTGISPVLETCKAVLLTALAVSTLSSFIFSEYAVFGKKLGLGINLFAFGFWLFVAPLGVMGIWTLMAESRVYLILAMIIAAAILLMRDRRRVAK